MKSIIKNLSVIKIIMYLLPFLLIYMYINLIYTTNNINNNSNIIKEYNLNYASIKKENGKWKTVGYTKSILKYEDHKKIIAYTNKEPKYKTDKTNKNMVVKIYQKNNKYYTEYNKIAKKINFVI